MITTKNTFTGFSNETILFLKNLKKNNNKVWFEAHSKNFYLVCNREIDNHLFGRELLTDLTLGFGLLKDFYNFLLQIKLK